MTNPVIIIVEEDASVRNLIKKVLGREYGEEFGIITFENAESAIRFIDTSSPHVKLIVTDHIMKGMNGISFINELREKGYYCGTILMSGDHGANNVPSTARCDAFLPKPFPIEDLLSYSDKLIQASDA